MLSMANPAHFLHFLPAPKDVGTGHHRFVVHMAFRKTMAVRTGHAFGYMVFGNRFILEVKMTENA
jgi:hypothetical protein